MKPLRIALVRRRFSPTGGAERYLERLARAMGGAGHELTLWCEQWKGETDAFHSVRTVNSADPLDFAKAIARQQLRREHDLVFSLERIESCDLYRAGDGVHAEWLHMRARYAPLLGRLRNAVRRKNRSICKLERRLFRPDNLRVAIANSARGKDEIVRWFDFPSERVEIIYNGVPYAAFSQGDRERGRQAMGWKPNELIVLLVGSGKERKGVRYAEKAVAKADIPGMRLFVVDTPPPVSMPDLYAAADIFVLPTLYDPFANVTLEALAAGLPVITSVHNGAAEVITHGHDGLIIPRADAVQEMAGWLKHLADPDYRSRWRQPAQELAQKFDIGRNAVETTRVCLRLATEKC